MSILFAALVFQDQKNRSRTLEMLMQKYRGVKLTLKENKELSYPNLCAFKVIRHIISEDLEDWVARKKARNQTNQIFALTPYKKLSEMITDAGSQTESILQPTPVEKDEELDGQKAENKGTAEQINCFMAQILFCGESGRLYRSPSLQLKLITSCKGLLSTVCLLPSCNQIVLQVHAYLVGLLRNRFAPATGNIPGKRSVYDLDLLTNFLLSFFEICRENFLREQQWESLIQLLDQQLHYLSDFHRIVKKFDDLLQQLEECLRNQPGRGRSRAAANVDAHIYRGRCFRAHSQFQDSLRSLEKGLAESLKVYGENSYHAHLVLQEMAAVNVKVLQFAKSETDLLATYKRRIMNLQLFSEANALNLLQLSKVACRLNRCSAAWQYLELAL